MKRTLLISIMLLCAATATAQNDRDGFTRCHLLLDQLFLGGTQLTGTSWSCAADSVTCNELLSAGNLVTGSELSAGDIVSMTPGAGVWHTFEVTAVGANSTFTRSSTTCSGTGTHDYVLEGITSSALWRHGDGITAKSLQLYDSVGNAGAAGLSTTELWATELRVGGSAGAVCLEDDSGELDVTDCAGGAGDLSAGTITADSIMSSSGTYLAVDTVLDAASGNEISAHIEYEVDKVAGDDTGLRITKTDTASPGASNLFDGYVGSTQRFGFTDAGGMLLIGALAEVQVDGGNAATEILRLTNTNEPASGETSDTAELQFHFFGSTDSGSTYSSHVAGSIKAIKESDYWGTDETDYDSSLEFFTTQNGTATLGLTIDAGKIYANDIRDLSGTLILISDPGLVFGSSRGVAFTNVAAATGTRRVSLNGYYDGALHWAVIGDGLMDGVADGNLATNLFKVGGNSGPIAQNSSGTWQFRNNANDDDAPATMDSLTLTGNDALTLTGDATVWDDMTIPVEQVFIPGAKAPSWEAFSAGYLLGFEYQAVAGNEEEVAFTRQIPHDYLEGSDIIPHVHWSPETDDSATARWCLEYEWRNIGGTYSSTTTVCADQAIDTEASDHVVTGLSSGIDGTGMTISSELICRLYRNSSHVNDDFDDKALLIEFDFHYQIDSQGSRTEYVK
jgi:hypothetical protein